MDLRKLVGKKPDPPEENEEEVWTPPSSDAARRRLMVLWANFGRSYIENDIAEGRGLGDKPFEQLQAWLLGPLRHDATPGEIARHEMALGEWPPRLIMNDYWDCEAAIVLQWALGLEDQLPAWDRTDEWAEATDDFFDFPDPSTWRSELTLRSSDEIEQMARSYEARYWRIRSSERPEQEAYGKKLMARAHQLGQVELAPDGDLAFSDGTSIMDAPAESRQAVTSIVIERLQALNWLCGQEASWDDVTCDTIVSWLWDEHWPS